MKSSRNAGVLSASDNLADQSSDVISYVNNFLDKAIKQKVSDIHIEPNFKGQNKI